MASILDGDGIAWRALRAAPETANKFLTHDLSSFYLLPSVAGYFVYVTLGSFSPALHEHAFTGDENMPVLERVQKGCPVTIPPKTYREFYFPAYFKYWTTYRLHTLGAGIWLLTGFYNLRNPPQLAKLATGKLGYPSSVIHRASGYLYLLSGFLKGVTVPLMALYSHSLHNLIRIPLAALGVWDVVSLAVAFYYIGVKRNVALHRRWMIRNFCVGAGSIWVRVFGAVWAACDLSFMKDPAFFGQMNGICLLGGFYYGALYGEWKIATTKQRKRVLEIAMGALCAATAVAGKRLYIKRAAEKRAAHRAVRGNSGGSGTA